MKLVITGHGEFSGGILGVIDFIMGDVKDIVKVEFDNSDLETYSNRIEEIIKESKEGTLIFTDIVGGTPFRISTLLCTKYDDVSVITGVNIPMIIESIIKRDSMTLKELSACIAEMGRSSIQVFDRQLLAEKSRKYQKD